MARELGGFIPLQRVICEVDSISFTMVNFIEVQPPQTCELRGLNEFKELQKRPFCRVGFLSETLCKREEKLFYSA